MIVRRHECHLIVCESEAIPSFLGLALPLKTIHYGKAQNDPLDVEKIAGPLPDGLRIPAGQTRDPRPAPPAVIILQPRTDLPPFDKKLTEKKMIRSVVTSWSVGRASNSASDRVLDSAGPRSAAGRAGLRTRSPRGCVRGHPH